MVSWKEWARLHPVGCFHPRVSTDRLTNLTFIYRNNILRNPTRLKEVIGSEEFIQMFGKAKPDPKGQPRNIFGREDTLKVAPKGVDKNHPYVPMAITLYWMTIPLITTGISTCWSCAPSPSYTSRSITIRVISNLTYTLCQIFWCWGERARLSREDLQSRRGHETFCSLVCMLVIFSYAQCLVWYFHTSKFKWHDDHTSRWRRWRTRWGRLTGVCLTCFYQLFICSIY